MGQIHILIIQANVERVVFNFDEYLMYLFLPTMSVPLPIPTLRQQNVKLVAVIKGLYYCDYMEVKRQEVKLGREKREREGGTGQQQKTMLL